MKQAIWAAIAAMALVGCNQPSTEQQGAETRPGQTAQGETPEARAELADAFLEAARVHASLVRNDSSTATAAIRQVREELASAKTVAPLDTQARINELDQVAIETQQAIERNEPGAYQASERLVDQMQVAMSGAAPGMSPEGGGAGTAPGVGTETESDTQVVPPPAEGPDGTMNQPAPADPTAPLNQGAPMNQPNRGTTPETAP